MLNHERLTRLADEVGRSVGREIRVVVGRKEGVEDVERELRLVPRTGWGGRGEFRVSYCAVVGWGSEKDKGRGGGLGFYLRSYLL